MLNALSTLALLSVLSGQDTTRAGTVRTPLPKLDSAVSALSPDGRRLAIAAPPDRVLVLDLPSGEVGAVLTPAFGRPVAIAWRASRDHIAVLDSQAGVTVFDAASGRHAVRAQCAPELPGTSGYDLRSLTWITDTDDLLVGFGSLVTVLDGSSGTSIARIESEDPCEPSALALSRDGRLVAIGDRSGRVGVWDVHTSELRNGGLRVPTGSSMLGVHSLDFDSKSLRLAIGAGDCVARVWTLDGSMPMREYSHHETDYFGDLAIGHVEFSADDTRLAATSFEWWETRIWEPVSGRVVGNQDLGGGSPAQVDGTFTTDGQFLVVEFRGIVLDASSGRYRHALEKSPNSWVWYRAGGKLAWGVDGGSLRVCEIESGLVVLDRALEPD